MKVLKTILFLLSLVSIAIANEVNLSGVWQNNGLIIDGDDESDKAIYQLHFLPEHKFKAYLLLQKEIEEVRGEYEIQDDILTIKLTPNECFIEQNLFANRFSLNENKLSIELKQDEVQAVDFFKFNKQLEQDFKRSSLGAKIKKCYE